MIGKEMDYFQGVVTEYLRADRAVFVNTEYCIQVNDAPNPDMSGPHWYCDAVAVDHRNRTVFLCEITYSKSLDALRKRLTAWAANWSGIKNALVRDSALPADWAFMPWLFVPQPLIKSLEEKIQRISNVGNGPGQMPYPKITDLESIMPWKYRSWNRQIQVDDAEAA